MKNKPTDKSEKELDNMNEEQIAEQTSKAENTTEENVDTENTKSETEIQAEEIANLNDKYIRLYSEFDNYKKRVSRERSELIKYAGSEVISSMLTILDDFERAIKSTKESDDVKAIKEGVGLIHNKIKTMLTQKGVSEMKSMGEIFDTEFHDAVANAPAPSEDQKGKVVEELEKGYFLNGKVIRHAKVIVGN